MQDSSVPFVNYNIEYIFEVFLYFLCIENLCARCAVWPVSECMCYKKFVKLHIMWNWQMKISSYTVQLHCFVHSIGKINADSIKEMELLQQVNYELEESLFWTTSTLPFALTWHDVTGI